MPSRVILISANRCTAPDAVFPLGLAYLSAALRRAGHECHWLDVLVDGEDLGGKLAALNPHFVALSLRNIDDIVIRKKETYFTNLAMLTDAARKIEGCKVILGGSGFSIFPRELLELSGADFGITGEGENSLVALINALETGSDHTDIPGLVFRADDGVRMNLARPARYDSRLVQGDRPERISRHYIQTSQVLNVQTQRGCGYDCCYCTYPLLEGKGHRRRPAEAVADEFEQIRMLGGRYAFIVDSVFNSSPGHVTEICEELVRRKVGLSWGCFLRPQHLDAELLRLMARAGLTHIEFGSDSFCDSVLEAYGKGFTFDDVLKSSELARAEKLNYCHFLISGGPGETLETLEEGFRNSKRLRDGVIMAIVGMRIYPGTSLFKRAEAEGRISPNANLLSPVYYLAPGLDEESVFEKLKRFARECPAWVVGDPEPGYLELLVKLRRRGVVGPLWTHLPAIRSIWSQPTAP